jgi:Carboxypeptidase regulatory-like domain/TonB-dependent Receptor Plug Domain
VRRCFSHGVVLSLALSCLSTVQAQNAGTGALAGTVNDATGAVISGATVTATNSSTGATRTAVTNSTGSYRIPALPPGTYSVEFSSQGFDTVKDAGVTVNVSEIETLNANLKVGNEQQTVTVEGGAVMLQTENVTLGGVVSEQEVKSLPLTNRNYTQILGLSPGVATDVTNAASLGRNTQDVYVNGGRAIDNNFQMDGIEINNFGTGRAGDWLGYTGIPIPNPDAIQEFKVQTGLYDAGYGLAAGANVEVVTKSGTNRIHGSLFEFFRNDALNANDYFLNQEGQKRPDLKQNQFGGTIGGPILKDKLFYFGSYQGTRQVNGEGSSSLQTALLPNITNDRSAATLGARFCGQAGYYGGATVACNGSNINPTAVALLNYKLPNGNYFVPTPQVVQADGIGISTFSVPSNFTEDQFLANVDYLWTAKNTISSRFFGSRDPEQESFTTSNTPGSGATTDFKNYAYSIKLSSAMSPNLLNEARFGYTRNYGTLETDTPAIANTIGMTPALAGLNTLPVLEVNGLFTEGGNWNDNFLTATNTYIGDDQVSWTHGKHNIRAGLDFARIQYNFDLPGGNRGQVVFQSFPDFLLGMSAAQNGSQYSNIYESGATEGITSRHFRMRNWASYVQDDWKLSNSLTVNLGARWDIYGGMSELNGEVSDFWPQLANNTFPSDGSGTFSGFMVASNYKGALPNGVYRNANNTCCFNGTPLGNWGPRVGLNWKPLKSDKVAVRAGYGIYYSRTSGNMLLQLVTMYPYSSSAFRTGTNNPLATFQVPFNPAPPAISQFPIWVSRTPTSDFTFEWLLPNWKAPMTQSFTLNTQVEVAKDWLAQVGYVGARATRLTVFRFLNQSYLASAAGPINGVTTNTVANALDRVPILGVDPAADGPEAAGFMWYNALQTSITKRYSHGVTLQAAYTYDRSLDSTPQSTGENSVWGGFSVGNVHTKRASWGPSDYDRPQRLVFNYVWEIPHPGSQNGLVNQAASGWKVSGVTTIQSGHKLSIYNPLSGNIYGTPSNLGQLCPGATKAQIPTKGGLTSRLSSYFNTSALCNPNPIGDGYDFGTLGRGAATGPGQDNSDFSVAKITPFRLFGEDNTVEFRAEFFNVFNHGQFTDPATTYSLSSFGEITSTSVAPRLIQFALKYSF